MDKPIKRYNWVQNDGTGTGQGLSGSSTAQQVGEIIEGIMTQKGYVKPSDIIEVAKDPDNLLHKYFEWDNGVAGNKWRESQARRLLATISIEVISPQRDGTVMSTKAFANIKDGEVNEFGKNNRYVFIEEVFSKENYKQQMVDSALREIKYWRDRYKEFSQFTPIVKAIDKVVKK